MSEGQRTTDVLRKINRPKPSSLFSKVRNLVIGTTAVAGSAMTAEAIAHPVQNVIDKAKTGVERTVGNIQKGTEALVNFYNEDPAIAKYNKDVADRLSGKSDLLKGEEIFEKVIVVPSGENYSERLEMKDNNELVNIRVFPATESPTGNPIKTLGTLPQGAEITNVIRVHGTQPNSPESGDWYGFLVKSPDSGASQMGYIYGIYGQPEPAGTAAGNISQTNIP